MKLICINNNIYRIKDADAEVLQSIVNTISTAPNKPLLVQRYKRLLYSFQQTYKPQLQVAGVYQMV